MAKDDRLYARFTLDFADNPKIAPLSDAAFRTFVEMILYSRRMLTDGFIPEGVARVKWGSSIDELASVCFAFASADPLLISVEGGWQIHDFAEHQTTRAEIESLRAKRQKAGRRGGRASGKARKAAGRRHDSGRSKPEASAEASAKQELKQVPKQVPKQVLSKSSSKTQAKRSQRQSTETYLEIPNGISCSTSPDDGLGEGHEPAHAGGALACAEHEPQPRKTSYPAAFEAFWAAYPRRVGKRKALTAWQRATRRADADTVLDGAKRLASDPNLPETQYVPHPATWLNRDGWEDQPLPPRETRRDQQQHLPGTRPEDWLQAPRGGEVVDGEIATAEEVTAWANQDPDQAFQDYLAQLGGAR